MLTRYVSTTSVYDMYPSRIGEFGDVSVFCRGAVIPLQAEFFYTSIFVGWEVLNDFSSPFHESCWRELSYKYICWLRSVKWFFFPVPVRKIRQDQQMCHFSWYVGHGSFCDGFWWQPLSIFLVCCGRACGYRERIILWALYIICQRHAWYMAENWWLRGMFNNKARSLK
jgi:hypothetical protein